MFALRFVFMLLASCLASPICTVEAQQSVSLIEAGKEQGGWKFDNGGEFPGAVGKLVLAREQGANVLQLHGDFSKGGRYVQMLRPVSDRPIDKLLFDIRVPQGVEGVTVRLIDGSDQCHQLRLRLKGQGGWQHVEFPVVQYFQKLQAGSPMDLVTKYDKWGGENDSQWHQPLKTLVFLAGAEALQDGFISLRNIQLVTAPKTELIPVPLPLNGSAQVGSGVWNFNQGNEFPGATGQLQRFTLPTGDQGLRMKADFSEGGQYVGIRRDVNLIGARELQAITIPIRSHDAKTFGLRLVDATGQCHQWKNLSLKGTGDWETIELSGTHLAAPEHWGGDSDGRWHGQLVGIELMVNKDSLPDSVGTLEVGTILATTVMESQAGRMVWSDSFRQPSQWEWEGQVQVLDQGKQQVLQLSQDFNQSTPTSATGPVFEIQPGPHRVTFRDFAKLESPDNSYRGQLELEVLDRERRLVETIVLDGKSGQSDWKRNQSLVTIPDQARFARFRGEIKKAAGEYRVDDIAISRLSIAATDQTIQDIRIQSGALGGLFQPEQPVAFQLTVNTKRPLTESEVEVRYSVKDYRGNEVLALKSISLHPAPDQENTYVGRIELDDSSLPIGQFFELHLEVPQGGSEPFSEFSGFARLPEAPANQFASDRIPFTVRNWDGRVKDYFYLSHRLGLRTLGVWGGWEKKPPYEPYLPGVQRCEELSLSWITGTPAAEIERNGFGDLTEEGLRLGIQNFLKAYQDRGLTAVALGNEPHGTGDKVIENVKAYRILYQAIKEFDSEVHVLGTSVEPNREYFEAGYQNYLDSYDFHIYESYENVRRTMREYRALMEEFDATKPLHSTELGLNSQGLARTDVACEMIKKCTVFFAEGGATVGWFTIQYPDPAGKARGQFGDAHCMFDCKFNNYNARLDAVTYYHLINSLLEKTFVSEQASDDGCQQFLFQSPETGKLWVVWNDQQTARTRVKVGSGKSVRLIHLDGRQQTVTPQGDWLDLEAGREPILVLSVGNKS